MQTKLNYSHLAVNSTLEPVYKTVCLHLEVNPTSIRSILLPRLGNKTQSVHANQAILNIS